MRIVLGPRRNREDQHCQPRMDQQCFLHFCARGPSALAGVSITQNISFQKAERSTEVASATRREGFQSLTSFVPSGRNCFSSLMHELHLNHQFVPSTGQNLESSSSHRFTGCWNLSRCGTRWWFLRANNSSKPCNKNTVLESQVRWKVDRDRPEVAKATRAAICVPLLTTIEIHDVIVHDHFNQDPSRSTR